MMGEMVSASEANPPADAGLSPESALLARDERCGSVARRQRAEDPLGPILSLGRPQRGVGFAVGLAGALFVHGAAAATGLERLLELEAFADRVQGEVVEYLRAQYDVDIEPTAPEPPTPELPEPPPEPAPQPESQPLARVDQPAAPESPPPEAAQAAAALTAEPDPDRPLDLTADAFTIVTGGGDRYAGGQTERNGTSKQAVHDPRARAGGVPGGVGTAAEPRPPPPKKDLSRPPRARPGANWNACGFPAQADVEQIDQGTAKILVTVGPDGRAKSVVLQSDSGYGFGAHARQCALRMPYFEPGLDRDGKPTTASLVLPVRFTR